jgi:hypothetical protein
VGSESSVMFVTVFYSTKRNGGGYHMTTELVHM